MMREDQSLISNSAKFRMESLCLIGEVVVPYLLTASVLRIFWVGYAAPIAFFNTLVLGCGFHMILSTGMPGGIGF